MCEKDSYYRIVPEMGLHIKIYLTLTSLKLICKKITLHEGTAKR